MLSFTANVPEVYSNMQTSSSELKQIHIKLESDLHQALKLEAAYSETTIQNLVVGLIRQQISRGEFANIIKSDQ